MPLQQKRPAFRLPVKSLTTFARQMFRPKVIISLTLSAGLLAGLLSFGNASVIVEDIASFQIGHLVWYVGLFTLYEIGRWLLWHYLVTSLGARIPRRAQLMSFSMGEVSKNLPMGNYFPNYLLKRSAGADFGFTSAVTTSVVLLEVAASLLGIVLLGVGTWSTWLRPLILLGTPIFIVAAWVLYKIRQGKSAPEWMLRSGVLRRLVSELQQFAAGAHRLWSLRIIVVGLLICVSYVTAAGAALFVITQGLNITTVSLPEVVAVYCFSLAFALIEPTPVDLGVTEVGGVGAFLALGVDRDAAISAMLISRMLSVGMSIVLAALMTVILHRDVAMLLREQPSSSQVPEPDASPQSLTPALDGDDGERRITSEGWPDTSRYP